MAGSFSVLFTHQKVKKHKTWSEGTVKLNSQGNKVISFNIFFINYIFENTIQKKLIFLFWNEIEN